MAVAVAGKGNFLSRCLLHFYHICKQRKIIDFVDTFLIQLFYFILYLKIVGEDTELYEKETSIYCEEEDTNWNTPDCKVSNGVWQYSTDESDQNMTDHNAPALNQIGHRSLNIRPVVKRIVSGCTPKSVTRDCSMWESCQ